MYEPAPKFKIGDLVVGAYDFLEYLYLKSMFPDHIEEPPAYVGVITSIDFQPYYFNEFIYEVLCTDGRTRFFLCEEIASLSNPWQSVSKEL